MLWPKFTSLVHEDVILGSSKFKTSVSNYESSPTKKLFKKEKIALSHPILAPHYHSLLLCPKKKLSLRDDKFENGDLDENLKNDPSDLVSYFIAFFVE